MKDKLICHGECKGYYPKTELTFVTKTKRLCPDCLKTYNDKKAAKEKAKLRKEIEAQVRKEEAEKKRIKREKKRLENEKRKAEFAAKKEEEQREIITERNNLYYLVSRTFGLKSPTGMMFAQIKNFHVKKGMSYKGMALAWKMIVGIKGRDNLDINYGVGLIPYYYEKAIEEYQRQQRQAFEVKKVVPPTKTAVVVPQKKPSTREKLLQRKMVNMEEL